jgi:hypothetical protein
MILDSNSQLGDTKAIEQCPALGTVKDRIASTSSSSPRSRYNHAKAIVDKERLYARMRAIGNDGAIQRTVMRKRVVDETARYLDDLARSVRECKRVDEASRFARWLIFSGILDICREDGKSASDADRLAKVAIDLQMDCGELFRGGKADPNYAQSDIAELMRKVEEIGRFINAAPADKNPCHKKALAPGSEA